MVKTLNEIKHGDRVYKVLVEFGPMFHKDIEDRTSLDSETTRKALASLHRNGHIKKDPKGRWTIIVMPA